MDISRRRKATKVVAGSLAELYPHNLQMYDVYPVSDISLTEFEELAFERLKREASCLARSFRMLAF